MLVQDSLASSAAFANLANAITLNFVSEINEKTFWGSFFCFGVPFHLNGR